MVFAVESGRVIDLMMFSKSKQHSVTSLCSSSSSFSSVTLRRRCSTVHVRTRSRKTSRKHDTSNCDVSVARILVTPGSATRALKVLIKIKSHFINSRKIQHTDLEESTALFWKNFDFLSVIYQSQTSNDFPRKMCLDPLHFEMNKNSVR